MTAKISQGAPAPAAAQPAIDIAGGMRIEKIQQHARRRAEHDAADGTRYRFFRGNVRAELGPLEHAAHREREGIGDRGDDEHELERKRGCGIEFVGEKHGRQDRRGIKAGDHCRARTHKICAAMVKDEKAEEHQSEQEGKHQHAAVALSLRKVFHEIKQRRKERRIGIER